MIGLEFRDFDIDTLMYVREGLRFQDPLVTFPSIPFPFHDHIVLTFQMYCIDDKIEEL